MRPVSLFLLSIGAGVAIEAAVLDASKVVIGRALSCTFTDAAAASKSKTACSDIILDNIAVPAGETLDLTGLESGTHVTFQGTTTFGYKEWAGPLISISGSSLTVSGAPDSILDGQGSRWWDTKGSNGGKKKPKFFYAHKMKSSSIAGITIKDSPVQVFSINGAQDLDLTDITIDNSAGDAGGLGHNTDAFDVGSSSGVTISGANVKNQDDCLAVNSGSDITFTGGTCSGGHGLSIGSVGGRSDNDVSNVLVSNSTVSNSDNGYFTGVRIKTVSGATGSVSNVTYSSITLDTIAKYGIVIEQDYENGSPTGDPTAGVPITDVTLENISGSVDDSGKNVYILCASCSEWTWDNVRVTGGKKADCQGLPTGVSC
ncbi:Polygalacturonase 1 [Lecanora helva]